MFLLLLLVPVIQASPLLFTENLQFSTFLPQDKCYEGTNINFNYSSTDNTTKPLFKIINESTGCFQNYVDVLRAYGHREGDEPSECPNGIIDIDVAPNPVFDNQESFPYMRINISTRSFDKATDVFIRFQCLYAPDGDDTYCHNSEAMVKNGQWLWPCRSLHFPGKGEDVTVEFPFRFDYKCWRVFGLSHYTINVTMFPHFCRSNVLISLPRDFQLFPRISEFYDGKANSRNRVNVIVNKTGTKGVLQNLLKSQWSPMISVDFTDSTGALVRIRGPDDIDERVTVVIHKLHAPGRFVRIYEYELDYPLKDSYKWSGIEAGEYLIYAYVKQRDCEMFCQMNDKRKNLAKYGSGSLIIHCCNSTENCLVCPHTAINFTVPAHRGSVTWKVVRAIENTMLEIVLSVLILVLVLCLAFVIYTKWVIKRRRAQEIALELENLVSVLMIYSDDCEEHCEVVSRLGQCLRNDAHTNVHLDSEELLAPGARPSTWLTQQFIASKKRLIVISPCSNDLLNIDRWTNTDGKRLQQRRPFPDLFLPGVELIVRSCTEAANRAPDSEENGDPRQQNAIVRLPYSPKTPLHLSVHGFKEFELPGDFATLTAFLHSVDTGSGDVESNLSGENLQKLTEGIDAMQKMIKEKPDWKESRWDIEPPTTSTTILSGLAENVVDEEAEELTDEKRRLIAEKYNLEAPDESEEDEAEKPKKFELLPPDSDSDEEEAKYKSGDNLIQP